MATQLLFTFRFVDFFLFESMAGTSSEFALSFKIIKKCSTTKARASVLTLPHATVRTPIFMPVGTQGTLKGLLPEQLEQLNCNLMLSNTYHLGMRPVRNISGDFNR